MNIRVLGLVPVFALAMMGAAYAQSPGGMAYPAPNPSGEFKIPAPTARDTGNMAYPASPGGLSTTAPSGPGVGNMAYPAGRPLQQPAPAGGSTAAAVSPAPSAAPRPCRIGDAHPYDA